MCGISGFSLKASSTINARELAHALLSEIESRGGHASGFAFSANKKMGFYKDAVRGGQLPLRTLPRDAKTVILHTRFSTHGPESENENNHPVMSPDMSVAVTHNGVISNHEKIRDQLGEIGQTLPEVDTAVIPALLQKESWRAFSRLSGYASLAWLKKGEKDILHLGKLKQSPVMWTQLHDGSFVYASTASALRNALRAIGVWHGGIMELHEREYIQVSNGVIVDSDQLPTMAYESYNSYSRYSSATSGQGPAVVGGTTPAKKASSLGTTKPVFQQGSENEPRPAIGSSFGKRAWEEDDAEIDAAVSQFRGQIHDSDTADMWDDEDWDNGGSGYPAVLGASLALVMDDETEDTGAFPGDEMFYTLDMFGNQKGYKTLEELESTLIWHAGLTTPATEDYFGATGEAKWVNHFLDVGELSEKGDMISWIDNRQSIDEFKKESINGDLDYIKDGVDLLIPMLGMLGN